MKKRLGAGLLILTLVLVLGGCIPEFAAKSLGLVPSATFSIEADETHYGYSSLPIEEADRYEYIHVTISDSRITETGIHVYDFIDQNGTVIRIDSIDIYDENENLIRLHSIQVYDGFLEFYAVPAITDYQLFVFF